MANYLIIRTATLGDVALSLRMVYAVADRYPQHRFTYLMHSSMVGLLVNPPHNLEAMVIDPEHPGLSFWEVFFLARRLRYEAFDFVIDLERSTLTRFLAKRIKCKKRYRAELPQPSPKAKRLYREISIEDTTHYLALFEQTFAHLGLNASPPYPTYPLRTPPQIESSSPFVVLAPFHAKDSSIEFCDSVIYWVKTIQKTLPQTAIYIVGYSPQQKHFLEQHLKSVHYVQDDSLSYIMALFAHSLFVIAIDNGYFRLAELVEAPILPIVSISKESDSYTYLRNQLNTISKSLPNP